MNLILPSWLSTYHSCQYNHFSLDSLIHCWNSSGIHCSYLQSLQSLICTHRWIEILARFEIDGTYCSIYFDWFLSVHLFECTLSSLTDLFIGNLTSSAFQPAWGASCTWSGSKWRSRPSAECPSRLRRKRSAWICTCIMLRAHALFLFVPFAKARLRFVFFISILFFVEPTFLG